MEKFSWTMDYEWQYDLDAYVEMTKNHIKMWKLDIHNQKDYTFILNHLAYCIASDARHDMGTKINNYYLSLLMDEVMQKVTQISFDI